MWALQRRLMVGICWDFLMSWGYKNILKESEIY
jgi:hypothetical protein